MGRVPHLELGGPMFYREIVIGFTLGIAAAFTWKSRHSEMKRRTKAIYQQIDSGEISVVAEDY